MLLPDHIYRRIPKIWAIMGCLFLIFGLMAGSEFRYFGAYMFLGVASLARALWVHVARQRITRGREITVLTETQRMERHL